MGNLGEIYDNFILYIYLVHFMIFYDNINSFMFVSCRSSCHVVPGTLRFLPPKRYLKLISTIDP